MSTIFANPTSLFPPGYVTTTGNVVTSPGLGDTTYIFTLPSSINILNTNQDLSKYLVPSLNITQTGSLTTQDFYLLGGTSFSGMIGGFIPFSTAVTGPASLTLSAGSTLTLTGVLAGSAPTATVLANLKTLIDNVGPLAAAAGQTANYSTLKTYVDQFAGAASVSPATTGAGSTITLQAGATIDAASLGPDNGTKLTLDFKGGGDTFALTTAANIPATIALTFADFNAPSDVIDLRGIGMLKSSTATSVTTTANVTYTLSGLGGQGFVAMNDAFGGIELVACFGQGTRLLTDHGEVAVERLAVGDRVVSALDGESRAIVWIGSRTAGTGDDAPVRVRADAFGPGLPTRDLVLSPDHALLSDGALIPVRHLVDGGSIARAPGACDTYWHVELATHDAVFAEGIPAETFLDVGQRLDDSAVSIVVHPTQVARVWEAQGCAPILVDGPVVAAVRARLRPTVALAA